MARLVGPVLPSNFVVADALCPLPDPLPEADGKCNSRFFYNRSEADALQDFRSSPLWRDRLEDTIFSSIEPDGSIVKLEECFEKVKRRRVRQPAEKPHPEQQQSLPKAVRSAEAVEMADALAKVEKAIADAKAKEAEMLAKRRKTKAQHTETEDRSNKPSKDEGSHSGKFAQPPSTYRRTSEGGENGHGSPHDSRRFVLVPRPDESTRSGDRLPSNRRHNSTWLPRHQNSAYTYRGQQYSPTGGYGSHTSAAPREMASTTTSQQGVEAGKRKFFDNKISHPSDVRRTSMSNMHETNHNRKRNFDAREESSSDEEDDSPKRQENDVTPRHKKRQPKVAAAYG